MQALSAFLGVGSSPTGDDAAEDAAEGSALHGDLLALVLEHADGYTLGRAMAVNKEWRDTSRIDYLWRRLVLERWQLGVRKHGKYKFGERSWKECWRVFHRRNRMPKIEGVSDREVAYASGREHRVACWMHVSHRPACKLTPFGELAAPHLCARLIVHNLRATPLTSNAAFGGQLTLKDGTRTSALPLEVQEGGEPQPRTLTLPPLSFAVAEVLFEMPKHMGYEPDALEACQLLQLSFRSNGVRQAPANPPPLRLVHPLSRSAACDGAASPQLGRFTLMVALPL